MPKVDPKKTYRHNDPFRPFTELTWQLVASMISEDKATPAEIASLFNRDVNNVICNIQEAHASGRLARIVRNLPQDIPEQSYRDLASRILGDAHRDAMKMKQRPKNTVKACRTAVRTVTDIGKFIKTGWAETLCTTANIDPEAYRNSIERRLNEFWAGVNCPLARKLSLNPKKRNQVNQGEC